MQGCAPRHKLRQGNLIEIERLAISIRIRLELASKEKELLPLSFRKQSTIFSTE
jgi:hypothetical protein